ncbi:MAG: MMPL family transporter, partial [Sphaerochaetaceae bacterium]
DNIQVILASHLDSDYHFSIIGLPVVKQQINRSLLKDIAILGPIVGLLIVFVLLFSFRRLAGIVLPLAGLLISASIAIGVMAVLKITFTMATMLVPVLLLIVGSAYAIHVMSHFYAEMGNFNSFVSREQTSKIIDLVLERNKLPIIMAGATTVAGFIAQLASPLGPFRTFGLLSALGVVLSQFGSLYLLPAMLRLTYRKGFNPATLRTKKDKNNQTKANRVFALFEKWALKRKVPMLVISAVLMGVTLLSLPHVRVGTNMIEFFNKKSSLVVDTNLYNTHMAGSGILTVMIDSKESSAILDPAFLEKLEEFSTGISQKEKVGKVQSLVPYIKRMNYLMNKDATPYRQPLSIQQDFDFFSGEFGLFDDTEEMKSLFVEDENIDYDPLTYLEIPTDPAKYALGTTAEIKELLAQYLLLYAGNLNLLIDDDVEPSATLITIQLRDSEASYLREINDEIHSYWEANLPEGWNFMVGGGDAITLALTDLVTKSQIYSLVGALVIVWFLVSLIFKSPSAGLIGLIPVVFALMGIFMFMVFLQIRLDVITSLLAALAIGVGVDYAIHFIAAFKRQVQANLGVEGISLTMNTTGKAIVINAASVIIGFSGLIFSRFIPIQQMGILFCVSMIFSSLASLTVLPMVLIWIKPKFLGEK